jgi:hypothetical protein
VTVLRIVVLGGGSVSKEFCSKSVVESTMRQGENPVFAANGLF